jgi:hypothetical protein
LKKCIPTSRLPSRTAAAIAAIGSDEVLVANSACAGAARSIAPNSSRLSSSRSGTARERGVAVGGGQLAELDPFREVLCDALDARARRTGDRVVHVDVEARHGGDVGDAVTHRAGADHRNGANLFQRGERHGANIREMVARSIAVSDRIAR